MYSYQEGKVTTTTIKIPSIILQQMLGIINKDLDLSEEEDIEVIIEVEERFNNELASKLYEYLNVSYS
jgi:hypothetical protein